MRATIGRIVVEGRSLTFILQNFRYKVPNFDDWYKLKNDPLLKFFKNLRSKIDKEGIDEIGKVQFELQHNTHIGPIENGIAMTKFFEGGKTRVNNYVKPENAIKFIIGDTNGGCCFLVKTLEDKTEKKYVSVPNDMFYISLLFDNPPTEYLMKIINDTSAKNLCSLYYNYLSTLCEEAIEKFRKLTIETF